MSRTHLLLGLALGIALSAPARAQAPDSALLYRILVAEDRRDATDPALAAGIAHHDPLVAHMARRAWSRITDPRFAARDSLETPPPPPRYTDPIWRLRYRALDPKTVTCEPLRVALTDESWPVRLRAADLVTDRCTGDTSLQKTLESWLPMVTRRIHVRGDVAWQGAAHALIALARMAPATARTSLKAFTSSEVHWLRVYAVRAAAVLADTQALRRAIRDPNDNVKEAAIGALSALTGHVDDSLYVTGLDARGYQAVRAAARALKGTTPSSTTQRALIQTAQRLQKDRSETSRDARLAVLERLAETSDSTVADAMVPLAEDFDCEIAKASATITSALGRMTTPACTPIHATVPPEAVALALGADVRVRVVMAEESGGGTFTVRLRGDVAPVMTARVLTLVRQRYYDGQAWHRVEPDFVIQGPSPGDNEYVGGPVFFRDELGMVPHVRGTVGMSTRGHDTGDGQWFVNLRDNLRLNRDYTVFGEIIEGLDVVDGILEGDKILRMEQVLARPERKGDRDR